MKMTVQNYNTTILKSLFSSCHFILHFAQTQTWGEIRFCGSRIPSKIEHGPNQRHRSCDAQQQDLSKNTETRGIRTPVAKEHCNWRPKKG
ncbi:hypothetical protein RP20_CCG005243 [Aedes albopictus]|nr:hypothetical protein RP20_CCG005243 [Aedes albopictus]